MKYQITNFIFCLFLVNNLFAQPPNDDCATAISLGEAPVCDLQQVFTNTNATQSVINPDIPPECFNGGVTDRDVWFTFSTPADGLIVDFEIVVSTAGAAGMVMPQVALYRAEDCSELQELACASAPINETEVELELFGLSPGETYWIRVNDYTASGTPNSGTFNICVNEYIPDINMGEAVSSEVCSGTLNDSGGPDNPYSSNEDLTFTICPTDFFQCLLIDVVTFDIESNDDFLRFYAGSDVTAPQIGVVTGVGNNYLLQTNTCVTVEFQSDGFTQRAGFILEWECSSQPCTAEISSCANPTVIPSLPYSEVNLTTCLAGNTVTDGDSPCTNDFFLNGDDYVFTYDSPGDECIQLALSGQNSGTGVVILDDCPNTATDCIGFDNTNGEIESAYLENAGTYYIVIANSDSCTPFDLEINVVNCPVIFPSAPTCDESLSLNGCNNEQGVPAVVSVAPGLGDPNFINYQNDGCIGGGPLNYTFFYFQAANDGEFAFTLFAQNPLEASDIDFSVWGPYSTISALCDSSLITQPTRSSYAGGADPTGLASVHPGTGLPVTDEYDCYPGNNDDFVSPIEVQAGEYYLVWINDWGNNITSGNMSIDFGETSNGVLDPVEESDEIYLDTVICLGETLELIAPDGDSYSWENHPTLSCTDCTTQTVMVTPVEPTTYQVTVTNVCITTIVYITVDIYEADAGEDIEVCLNDDFQLNVGSTYSLAEFQWTALDTASLEWFSCTDCGNPLIEVPVPGFFEYEVEIITPNCSLKDTIAFNIIGQPAPQIIVAPDTVICAGQSVMLGGDAAPGVEYIWASNPTGFSSLLSNPEVAPDSTTKYYVLYTNQECPLFSVDSVLVEVIPLPIITLENDTTICQDSPVQPGLVDMEEDVVYSWSPEDIFDDPADPNGVIFPQMDDTYVLSATRDFCTVFDTINIDVTAIELEILNEDSVTYCKGDTIFLNTDITPADQEVVWGPFDGSLSSQTGTEVFALPDDATTYFAQINVENCFKIDSVFVDIDSIPLNMDIMPLDTTICEGAFVTLQAPVFDPIFFPEIEFEWSPLSGQQTPDSLYNMVVQPSETTTYVRESTNGVCTAIDTARVTVIPVNYINVLPNPAEICIGDQIQLDATTPDVTGYEWMPGTALSCTDCPDPIASPTSTTAYMVTGEFMGCPVSGNIVVSVPTPIYQFPNPNICLGESIALNTSPDLGTIYTWTSDDPDFGTSNEPAPVVSPTVNTTYYLYAESGGVPCTATDSVTIIVVGEETITIVPGDTTICTGETITFEGVVSGGDGDISWEYGTETATGSIVEIEFFETVLVNVAYDYGADCIATDQVLVTVLSDPIPDPALPTDTQLCIGESAVLNSNPEGIVAYTWTASDPDFSSTDPSPVVTPDETTTYYLYAETGPCGIVEDSVTLTVYPDENVTIAPGDITLCQGEPLTLTASTDGDQQGTVVWTYGNNMDTGAILEHNFIETTEVSVVYTVGDDCVSTDAITVTVLDDAYPDIQFPEDNELCSGESVTLNENPQGFVEYEWTSDDPSFTSTDAAPSDTPTTETTYYVVATNGECVVNDSITIFVYEETISIETGNLCWNAPEEVTATITTNTTDEGIIDWSVGNSNNSTITISYDDFNPDNPSPIVTADYLYGDGCLASASTTFMLIPEYFIELTAEQDSAYVKDDIELTAVDSNAMSVLNYDFGNGPSTASTASVVVEEDGVNEFSVTVTDEDACEVTAFVTVVGTEINIAVPNVFTPDSNDKANNVFKIMSNVGAAGDAVDLESFQIFNRWGQLVWESTSLNLSDGWDGNFKDTNTAAPSDVYVFVVKLNLPDGPEVLHGEVSLIR